MRARYGRTPPARWKRWGLVGLLAAVLVSAGIAGWVLVNPAITAKLLAYQVVSDTRADLTFEVHRPVDRVAVCVIRGQDATNHDVGYATVRIPAGSDYVQGRYSLATRARAAVVELLGCALDSSPQVPAPQFPPGTANPPQQSTVAGG